MRLKTKYILFIAILHLTFLGLSYLILKQNKIVFIISEVLIILSVVVSVGLYRQLIQPLSYLKEGINAIKDRDFSVKFLPTGKKEMDELIDVYNEMMDALREERTRQEEQHFFLEKLIHTSPTGIIVLDYDNQIKQTNPKAKEILFEGDALFLAEVESLKYGESKTIKIGSMNTYKIQKSNFIDRGFARVFIMIEELTAEIFKAEKNAYGKVIRMMAHEVNNTVGPVNSILNVALGTGDLWADDRRLALKNAIQVAVERNQNLNLFMRNFADLVKLSPVNRISVNLNLLVIAVVDLMKIKAEQQGVSLDIKLPIDPFYINADGLQLEQVLINIMKNAMESIEGRGSIAISLNAQTRQLVLADSGKGISPGHAEKLFSPFFSTKKEGQGIGLTLVREILLNHNYSFSLKTLAPGVTEFNINF
jgi:two-component system nitrogen regulation sensor histidine kinase NtrY